jgi:recombination protein RecR
MQNPLESFEDLIEALMGLPGVGKKSARNLAYHMAMGDSFGAMKLSHAIERAIQRVRRCDLCGGLSEHELCGVCADEQRDTTRLCLVFSAKDIFTLEESGFYQGRYFVCGEEVAFGRLEKMIAQGVEEVIFAFPPSIQNDALIYFIEERLSPFGLSFSKIAQGIPTGVNLENVDMLSLSRALEGRIKI